MYRSIVKDRAADNSLKVQICQALSHNPPHGLNSIHSVRELDSRLVTTSILQDLDAFAILGFNMDCVCSLYLGDLSRASIKKMCTVMTANQLSALSDTQRAHTEHSKN